MRAASVALLLSLVATVAAATPSLVPIRPGMGGGTASLATGVEAQVVADTTAWAPGKAFTVGVVLTTKPEYHIYWSNPGEGGLATTVKVEAPQGFKVEALPFPTPYTFVQPGDIKVYGYGGKTTFLYTITPPATPPSSSAPATFNISASWLNCNKDACTPGNAKLNFILPKGEGKPDNQELFTAARELIPSTSRPSFVKDIVPIDQAFLMDNPKSHELGATIEWGQRYAPGRIEAYPEDVEGLKVDRVLVQPGGGNAFTRVSLHAYVMKGYKLSTDKLNVVIAYDKPDPANPTGRGGRGGPAWFAGPNDPPGRRTSFVLPVDLKAVMADRP